jgi:hypothetical protein
MGRILLSVGLFLLLVGQVESAVANTPAKEVVGDGASAAALDYARSLVRATYPGLVDIPRLRSRASTYGAWDDKPWTYEIVEVQVNPREIVSFQSADDIYRTLLNVVLEFDRKGLKSMYATGQHVSQEQLDPLTRTFEANGPWRLDRVRQQLRNARAVYYDDQQEVRALLPLQEWQTLFGAVRVSTGTLGVSDPPSVSSPNGSIGMWTFTVKVERPFAATYGIDVEPFGGRVVSMRRQG